MAFVGKAIKKLFIGPVLGAIIGGGKKKNVQAQPQPMLQATRDDAAAQAAADDELRRRKGSAADMLTGARGAEAAAGSVGKLVIGN